MNSYTIRFRLTLWYSVLVVLTVLFLGAAVYKAAAWGVRKAADQELSSGLTGIDAFLQHKLAIHDMDNLGEELREHSALMPRGKMFRVRDVNGKLVYQPDLMIPVADIPPYTTELRGTNQVRSGYSYRTMSRITNVGPYVFTLQAAVDQTEYDQLLNRLMFLLICCIPVGGCLAALVGRWMSGKVLAPVHRITATAQTIDAHHLERRLSLQGNGDELDQLSGTINSMLDRISDSYDRIAQFTADASHELRAPVAVVRSTAELLLMDITDHGRVQRGLHDIVEESDSMTRLLSDLLTLARGGLEEYTGNKELFDLSASVSAMVPRAKAQAALKNIGLISEAGDGPLAVEGNQVVAERVLMILVDNAIRYTHPGGTIRLKTWREGLRCGFTIVDSGIGIAHEHRNRIFERFYRVNSARTPGDGSSGLGLSIAKSLLDLHGGSIQVESELGMGSSFEVSFTVASHEGERVIPSPPHT